MYVHACTGFDEVCRVLSRKVLLGGKCLTEYNSLLHKYILCRGSGGVSPRKFLMSLSHFCCDLDPKSLGSWHPRDSKLHFKGVWGSISQEIFWFWGVLNHFWCDLDQNLLDAIISDQVLGGKLGSLGEKLPPCPPQWIEPKRSCRYVFYRDTYRGGTTSSVPFEVLLY